MTIARADPAAVAGVDDELVLERDLLVDRHGSVGRWERLGFDALVLDRDRAGAAHRDPIEQEREQRAEGDADRNPVEGEVAEQGRESDVRDRTDTGRSG